MTFIRPSDTQRFETLTLAATWVHSENTMLNERSQTQKDTQGVTPLRGNVEKRYIHRVTLGSLLSGAVDGRE